MPVRDVVVSLPGITQKQHHVRRSSTGIRKKYPFKGMIRGDYFLVESQTEVLTVRSALKSFYKRYPTRRFTVRQGLDDGLWVVRRI